MSTTHTNVLPRSLRIGLSILSGLLLGASFPPSELGVLAYFALVPLLIVLDDFERARGALRYVYVSMLVFHVIVLNWTGGYEHRNDPYMMIAGGVTMFFHPFFYFIPLGLYLIVKHRRGRRFALLALPFLWVGYEYSHSLSEWSFPWITIGNTQTYYLNAIQFITVTGVYGLSFWILLINAMAFSLYRCLAEGRFHPLSRQSAAHVVTIILIMYVPRVHGTLVLSSAEQHGNAGGDMTVGMVQSNVDPWKKWGKSGAELLELYIDRTRKLVSSGKQIDLVLWPETAIPDYLLLPTRGLLLSRLRSALDSLDVSLVTGVQHAVFYADSTLAPPSAKRAAGTGERFDVYNAAVFLEPRVDSVQWYGKMKMVPIAERIPYADAFYFFDFLRWGVGIGGWQIGPGPVVFESRNNGTRFCTVICYESTYPGYVAGFVRNGAEFISIITIDSWWGRMSGSFQHQQFAILRAIENRRWIARCAVGGFSCFIDPYGEVLDKTELFTERQLVRSVQKLRALTFYSRHGDIFAMTCACLGLLSIAYGFAGMRSGS